MTDESALLDKIEPGWPHRPLQLDAEGHFHFILGTKDEHDGIKVYASNPRVIESLVQYDEFRAEQFYCTRADDKKAKLDPDELDEHFDEVDTINAVDGMLSYDAVEIQGADGPLDVGDVIDFD